MTKEELLRSFLEDELFVEKSYLKEGEYKNYRWAAPSKHKLFEVLKTSIEGELSNESPQITEKKINQFLNKQT